MNPVPSIDRDPFRANFLKYTRMAWEMLPPMDRPDILDIACGSGIPTIELAKWSGGTVTGLDLDMEALERLRERAAGEGLRDRIRAVVGSFHEIGLPSQSFDIIWAEGAVNIMGFEMALHAWRRLLRPGGFLVLHDEAAGLERKLAHVPEAGYELIGHFRLPDDAWWREYYLPLLQEAERAVEASGGSEAAKDELARIREEAERCRSGSQAFRSVFMVMRKS
jgi:ubiquinone/menaquinone biosynthesis C-methylase UbiE